MGGDRNTVHLVSAEGVESWPELDKGEVARRLMQRRRRAAGPDHGHSLTRKKAAGGEPAITVCRRAPATRPGPRAARLPVRRRGRHGPAGGSAKEDTAGVGNRGARALVPTGLVCCNCRRASRRRCAPRSGLALRHGVTVLNSPGTIDSDYRGEVAGAARQFGRRASSRSREAERIAQLVVARVEQARLIEVTDVAPTRRGAGGFGSTAFKAKAIRARRRPVSRVKAVRPACQD